MTCEAGRRECARGADTGDRCEVGFCELRAERETRDSVAAQSRAFEAGLIESWRRSGNALYRPYGGDVGMMGPAGSTSFIVPGEPVPKARPRVTKAGVAYTPRAVTRAEEQIGWHFRAAYPHHSFPLDGMEYEVRVAFHRSNRRRCDIDNLLKTVLDALNGIAWADDSQVAAVHVSRKFVAKGQARTVIAVAARQVPNQ